MTSAGVTSRFFTEKALPARTAITTARTVEGRRR